VRVAVEGRKGIQLNQPRALHVTEGEGRMLWVVDELMTFKVSGEDTGGAYALTDSVVPPGGGPPPHIHHREDEAFWVLEGELEVMVGGDHLRGGRRLVRPSAQGHPAHLRERRHRTRAVSYPAGAGWVGEVLRRGGQAGE
jgi:mannose-6-phosphate isomerase-like protein (cupin superfamily)